MVIRRAVSRLWEDWCHDGDCGNDYKVGDNYGGYGDQHNVCDKDDIKKNMQGYALLRLEAG